MRQRVRGFAITGKFIGFDVDESLHTTMAQASCFDRSWTGFCVSEWDMIMKLVLFFPTHMMRSV